MKQSLVLILLLWTPTMFGASAAACRELISSLSFPTDEKIESLHAYYDGAEKARRECVEASLPASIRAEALMSYGDVLVLRDQGQTAIEAYRQAIEILERASGDQRELIVKLLDQLAYAETKQKLRTDAIAHSTRAVAIREQKFGKVSNEVVTGLVTLAMIELTFDDPAKSMSLLRSAVRIAEKMCEAQCDARAFAYAGMSAFYATTGNAIEAKRYDQLTLDATPPQVHAPRH